MERNNRLFCWLIGRLALMVLVLGGRCCHVRIQPLPLLLHTGAGAGGGAGAGRVGPFRYVERTWHDSWLLAGTMPCLGCLRLVSHSELGD